MRFTVKVCVFISSIIFIYGCRQTPNYNPFDDQFSISTKELARNGCDTIPAGCGYFNLQEPTGKFRVYYQVHIDNYEEVLAKGFTYIVDTFKMKKPNDLPNDILFDSICNLPFKIEPLQKEIDKFNYSVVYLKDHIVILSNKELLDTVYLGFDVDLSFTEKELIIIREMNYYKSKKTTRQQ